MENIVLREKDVVKKTGLTRGTIRNLEKKGDFPKRIKLTGKAIGWRSADINDWIESREYARI